MISRFLIILLSALWDNYSKVEVLLLENGLYLFRYAYEKTRDEVIEAKIWHMTNKPLILRHWSSGMQLLKLSLSLFGLNCIIWLF
jgi:hypothetical protein